MKFRSLKWNMIYHLLRCTWLVCIDRMVPKYIRFTRETTDIQLWTYKHFEDMYKIKEIP